MTLSLCPRWVPNRMLMASVLIGSVLFATSATALASHSRSASAITAAPRALVLAAHSAASADRALVAEAKDVTRCRAGHGKRANRCKSAGHLLQLAGARLAHAQRHLALLAGDSGKARVASAAGSAERKAPTLTISGATLRWTKVAKVSSYIVVRRTAGVADQYSVHKGTSFTPPAIPGATVRYSVRTSVDSSRWSAEKAVAYPQVSTKAGAAAAATPQAQPAAPSSGESAAAPVLAPASSDNAQAAPQLSVSGQTLNWNAVGGVSSYVLVRKVARAADKYTVVTGTSVTPTAIPGATARYSVRTDVDGSAWAPEVTIAYGSTPATKTTSPAPVTESSTPASASVGSTWVGVDAGGWGASYAPDIAGAVSNVRLDSASNIAPWTAAGLKVTEDMSGPYNSGGVSAINATEWAQKAVAWYRANPSAAAIEVLNEPGNQYIGWGANAGSAANAAAYDRLLKIVHEEFVANFGSNYPPLLASYDGGEGPTTWGEEMWAADPNVGSYINGITMHSYGGTSSRSASALGSRYHIEAAHSQHPGIPIYVTEVGWPTAVGQASTGDSMQWSEAEQAANIVNFVTWAKSTGYVADVTIFNYRDYGSNDWYGIESASGAHKLAYAALAAFPG
jgi:hypothetical protein